MKEREEIWATTEDNPFNPFTQWDRWMGYDYRMGYNTCDKIAEMCGGESDNLTEYENRANLDQAIIDLCSGGFVVDPSDNRVSFYRVVSPKTCVNW